MNIEDVDVSSHEDFANHEKLVRCHDKKTGLLAFISIHNRNRGPALGGCRIWPYKTEADAIKDVLRLSRGMTYKSAVANLPLGGGKAVIVGDPQVIKSKGLMCSMGSFVDTLQGHYIIAEDSGTSVEDMEIMATTTEFVAGIHDKKLKDGTTASGDPSPSTAYGVFVGIRASVRQRFGTADLDGVKIAVKGVGNVGRNLVKMLVDAGADVFVADRYAPAIEAVQRISAVGVVDHDKIHKLNVDVYSPCALGGALSLNTLVEMHAPVVAGAANNQLENNAAGDYLFHKGIIYAPDYVINAGGIIDIYYERESKVQNNEVHKNKDSTQYDHHRVIKHIDSIGDTLSQLFTMSEEQQASTQIMADQLAESRFLSSSFGQVA
ncbi:MAG: Glu/Leu/Phe/Val dehydrogenase dimerization domain-containing protein [bacterium]|nr:Glu/Leu/Phe/Val dehydrogenase [Gammaproteobacteria bacterium]HIL97351.1 Glu/Leu/Phe/Val dehydrogenase [Pseudomonadales bacterium]